MICAISVVNVLIKLYCFRSQSLPEDAPEMYERDAAVLGQVLADCLSAVQDPNEQAPSAARYLTSPLDFTVLVKLRDKHQTIQADEGICSQGPGKTPSTEETEHQALLRQYNEILKDRQDRGIGTGVERAMRWRHPAPGGGQGHIKDLPAPVPTPGAAANAAEVSASHAKKVSTSSMVYQ